MRAGDSVGLRSLETLPHPHEGRTAPAQTSQSSLLFFRKVVAGLLFGGRPRCARSRAGVDAQTPPRFGLVARLKRGTGTDRRRVRRGEQTLQQECSQEYPGSARCVQSFDDSLDSAIRITYRISLRSSSMWEPRHPSLKVVLNSVCPRRRSVLVAEFRPR